MPWILPIDISPCGFDKCELSRLPRTLQVLGRTFSLSGVTHFTTSPHHFTGSVLIENQWFSYDGLRSPTLKAGQQTLGTLQTLLRFSSVVLVIATMCDTNPCQNGGICQEAEGFHFCECVESYGGLDCTYSDVDLLPTSFIRIRLSLGEQNMILTELSNVNTSAPRKANQMTQARI
ncbi:hypothetical protein QR680_006819 [Steinernema hermaphroditum]|uniref:EGF-like domain-containing protein n=1 Tax=Steinernema hermaphroditum TaxID=289476 RepID=A0AA39HWK0_9BILA|nr:hypothetical protein QR680_006819 [Steinernema hermaphroditum]